MKTVTRLTLFGGVAVLAMALAGPALAAFTPSLDVSVPNALNAKGRTTVHVAVSPTDDATARLVIYSPVGFQVNGGASGTTIGTVDAKVRVADLGGALVPVTGNIEVRPPSGSALVSGVPVPLSTLAVQCTGTTAHTAYWVFALNAAGTAVELAAFFDTTAGAESALGTSKVTFCLPPDDVPAGAPGRSPLGMRLVDAVLKFNSGTYTNPGQAGAYIWSSIWTPYNPGVGTANAAGTVSAVSVTPLPVVLTLKGKYNKAKKSAALAGRITLAGQFQAGVKLPLFSGASKTKLKRSGSTGATKANGAFAAVKKIAKKTYFQVRFAIPAVEQPSICAALPAVGLPACVSSTVGGLSIVSKIVAVAVPKKK
jgi:hypothetical protein